MADKTEGYSGADLAALCNNAVMLAIRENIVQSETVEEAKEKAPKMKVSMEHLEKSLKKVKTEPKSEVKAEVEEA